MPQFDSQDRGRQGWREGGRKEGWEREQQRDGDCVHQRSRNTSTGIGPLWLHWYIPTGWTTAVTVFWHSCGHVRAVQCMVQCTVYTEQVQVQVQVQCNVSFSRPIRPSLAPAILQCCEVSTRSVWLFPPITPCPLMHLPPGPPYARKYRDTGKRGDGPVPGVGRCQA